MVKVLLRWDDGSALRRIVRVPLFSRSSSKMRALRCSYVLTAISFALPAHCCPSPLNHPVDQSPEVFSELAADLSPGAAIVSPGLPEHERWQAYKSPTYSAIVEVAVEEDVQKTVCVPPGCGRDGCSSANHARSASRINTATRSSPSTVPMAWSRPSRRCKGGSRYRSSI